MKYTTGIILLLFIVSGFASTAQDIYYPFTAGAITDAQFQSVAANALVTADHPAVLSIVEGAEVALSTCRPYLLKELGGLMLSAAFNDGSDNGFGLWAGYHGSALFNEKRIGTAYGRSLGKVKLGIKFQHLVCRFNRNDKLSFTAAGVASLWQINNEVYASLEIENPAFLKRKNEYPKLAGYNSLGLGWLASENCYVGCELKKTEGRPVSTVLLLNYRFDDHYHARMAWNSSSHQPYLSLAWKLSHFTIETGCSYHAVLGASPVVAVFYNPKSSTSE